MKLKDIKELLKRHNFRPSKRFGQNFLTSEAVLSKIIESAALSECDTVLEIGPGIGNLTQKLAEKAKRVISVEKDSRMIKVMEKTLKDFKNITVVEGDILKTSLQESLGSYKIVANLPYYIVSPLIRKFLETENPPERMILMVQKEVAQRIAAKPPKMSMLAVSVQFYADPKIISYVPKGSFWPAPKVDSAIIRITPRKKEFDADFVERFFKIAKSGFSQPRKQILNNLSKGLKLKRGTVENWLSKNNIEPTRRAETLEIKNWAALVENSPF